MKKNSTDLAPLVESFLYHKTDLEYYQFLKENEHIAVKLLNEVYYPQLIAKNDSVINSRGGGGAYKQNIQNMPRDGEIKLVNTDIKNFLFQFAVPGDGWPNSKPLYQVDIKFDKTGATDLKQLDVKVRCNCPFFIYNGPEYNASSGNYLFSGPRGTAAPPDVRDPSRVYYICKHINAVFSLINQKFRFPANYFKV